MSTQGWFPRISSRTRQLLMICQMRSSIVVRPRQQSKPWIPDIHHATSETLRPLFYTEPVRISAHRSGGIATLASGPTSTPSLGCVHTMAVSLFHLFLCLPGLLCHPLANSGINRQGDVSIVFGTSDTFQPNTPAQDSYIEYIQSAFVAFARDPERALSKEPFGWPLYVEDEDTLVRLAVANETKPDFVKGDEYDGQCGRWRS